MPDLRAAGRRTDQILAEAKAKARSLQHKAVIPGGLTALERAYWQALKSGHLS